MKYLKVFLAVLFIILFTSCKEIEHPFIHEGFDYIQTSVDTLNTKDLTLRISVSAVFVEYEGNRIVAEAANDRVAKILFIAREYNLLSSVKGLVTYHPKNKKYTLESAVLRHIY